jgi:hypothetical protein
MPCLLIYGQVLYLRSSAGHTSLLLLFFKKEEILFFSEEKNQKTFAYPPLDGYGTWPER